ncbi:bifunctional (p)ppGpp synthetase/guanosine-3',5'-bis(diphosphate) 3'-pyrophosphohydrolase, partial [bacterium]|nr:bifunctional (p)ppGpp synthetase/guanosine-3',5'-bis(diphosphate) 3'-pyrophosphohydrolase [bacterium]
TEVGHHCVGAKVNGSIVPLGYELQMGDQVEVLTNKNSGPSRDWLNIVKTSSARSKIRSYFSKVSREDDLIRGREELGKVMRKHGLGLSGKASHDALKAVAAEMNFHEADDLLAHIGAGKASAKQVAGKMLKRMSIEAPGAKDEVEGKIKTLLPDQPMLPPRSKRRRTGGGVSVKGIDDVLVRLAHCCNPVPGDDIVGFVTRGRGVSVHRADCPNARDLLNQPERIIEVEWDRGQESTYQVEIMIEAVDRMHLLQEVSSSLGEAGVNILSASATTSKEGIATMRFLFELGNMEQLQTLLRDVRNLEGVFEAERMLPSEALARKKGRR